MKDISRIKFVNELQVDWSFDDLIKDIKLPQKMKDLSEYDQAYFFTGDNKIIQGFLYLNENDPLLFVEPEPSILYYSNSMKKLDEIIMLRQNIFNSKSVQNFKIVDDLLFSDFFLLAFDFVMNLFAAIEAFNNSVVPEDFTFREKKEFFDRKKIQRHASFDLKTKKIIPKIFNKSFVVDFNKKHEIIIALKDIRDSLIHTKNFSDNWAASYRDIYKKLLAFDFIDSLTSTKDYMNYYKPDWIKDIE
jgi:hypothetical protein